MSKVLAVVTYLRDHYLSRFVQLGHHVLYTIPVWKIPSAAPPLGLTNVDFHVYPRTNAATQDNQASSPVIVVLGMCGGRSPPASILQPSTDWVAHAGRFWSHGTGSISGAVFLRERLLPLLSKINSITTIAPSSSTIERDKWRLEFSSWANDAQRTSKNCIFTPVPAITEEDVLRYQWDYQRQFNYDQHGAMVTVNGSRTVFSTSTSYIPRYSPSKITPQVIQ